ncbi:MAG: glycosyltransferase family 4 protein [Candidatus Aenigmatarchaeota archaeon]
MKPKLLIISREYAPMIAGVSKYVSEIAKRLNVEKTVLALKVEGRQDRDVEEVVYPTFAKKRVIKAAYFVLKSVVKSVRNDYDVLVGNAFIGGIAGALSKLFTGKPLVSIIYDIDFLDRNAAEYGKVNRFFRKHAIGFILASSDKIIVDSDKVEKDIMRLFGTDRQKIVTIPCGITPAGKFRKFGKTSKRVILFVGNMAEKKGLTDLVEAMALVVNKIKNAELWLVGPDAGLFAQFKKKLQEIVSKLDLSSRVKFIGAVKLVEPYYEACDFLVLPSRHSEGFGLPIAEAASFGKPSVATRIFEETGVINKKTGLIVPEQNPEKLSEAMLKFVKNKKLRTSMGLNAKKFSKRFDWDKTANKFEKVINDL